MPRYSLHAVPVPASRVFLAVPYEEKEDAKRHGAKWDPVLKVWWIARRDLADHPGIYRWIQDESLAAWVKQGLDFASWGGERQEGQRSPSRGARSW